MAARFGQGALAFIDTEPGQLTGVYKNMTRGIIALVFRCKITGGELAVNDEVRAFRWVSAQEVGDLSAEAYAIHVLDALNQGATSAIRQHDGMKLI